MTTPRPRYILHITEADLWSANPEQAARPSSLTEEGFVHCSTVDQILIPANERFVGRDDLLVLVIDTERLGANVVYEDCYDSGTAFPHIYGPIELSAVVESAAFRPGPDGRFPAPPETTTDLSER